MSEKVIVFTAPIAQQVLGDPLMFAKVVAMLHTSAQEECARTAEGRPYTIEHVRLVMGGNGPSFIRGLFDAEIRLMITVNDADSVYPQFPGTGAKISICDPGEREVKVLIGKKNGGHTYTVTLTPHMRGDQLVYAGYLEQNDTWYYTED